MSGHTPVKSDVHFAVNFIWRWLCSSHPGSPPNNDFPTSWSPNSFGGLNASIYWGNSQPIGDASWCDRYTENNTRLRLHGDPVAWSYDGAFSCYATNDTSALNDHDNATENQQRRGESAAYQRSHEPPPEYDHRVASRCDARREFWFCFVFLARGCARR